MGASGLWFSWSRKVGFSEVISSLDECIGDLTLVENCSHQQLPVGVCYHLTNDNALLSFAMWIGKRAFASLSQTATIRSLVCSREMPNWHF